MKILIVEDERHLATILKKGLEENNFLVDLAFDGEEGLFMAVEYPYDAIVLDINLPKVDGLTILDTIRQKKTTLPVIMLTAKGELADRIKGLNNGADDYITKPFEFSELLARVSAVIRRSKGQPSPVINISDLEINLNTKEVKRAGKEIKLSNKEFNLLEYLALNYNRVISRTEINEKMYDMDLDYDSNVIDVYINYLRNKIDKGFTKPLIHTVRGAGYKLSGE